VTNLLYLTFPCPLATIASSGPAFVKRIRVSYNFERIQNLRARVFDVDKGSDATTPGKEHLCNFLGSQEFVLGELVAAQVCRVTGRSLHP
jgi:hypothetical protein